MPRRPLLLCALALAAGFLAYGITRLALHSPDHAATAAAPEAQLAWLTREFNLNPAARAEIVRLQADYAPVCAAHCAAIAHARATLSSATDPAARSSIEAELARLQALCAESTRAHLQAVASRMPTDQAARFLALMEPRIAHSDTRSGAPALDGRP